MRAFSFAGVKADRSSASTRAENSFSVEGNLKQFTAKAASESAEPKLSGFKAGSEAETTSGKATRKGLVDVGSVRAGNRSRCNHLYVDSNEMRKATANQGRSYWRG